MITSQENVCKTRTFSKVVERSKEADKMNALPGIYKSQYDRQIIKSILSDFPQEGNCCPANWD